MEKNILSILFILSCIASISCTTFGKIQEENLTKYFDNLISSNGPGGIIGILKDGEVIYKFQKGYEDIQIKKPISENTLFDLASVSKHITAAAILHLIQTHKVQTSVLVESIIPEFKDKFLGRKMKLQDIVSMTAGLKAYEDQVNKRTSNIHDILKMLIESNDTFIFPTGTKYSYSNTAYSLIPLIVERISGIDFTSYLKREFFDKLDMKTANVLEHGLTFDWAKGYKMNTQNNWEFIRDATPFITGDGNIYFTFNDFVKWDRSLFNKTILNQASLDQTITYSHLDNGTKIDYSFGWVIIAKSGKVIGTEHEGSWDGTSTVYARYLDGYSYFAMFNIDKFDTTAVAKEINRIINTDGSGDSESLLKSSNQNHKSFLK